MPRARAMRVRHAVSMDVRALPVPGGWVPALESWASMMRAGGASEATLTTRIDHGRRLARAMGGTPSEVTPGRLTEWAGEQVWARDTRRSVYASLRSLWGHLLASGVVSVDAMAGLPAVRPATGHPRPIDERAYRRAVAAARGRLVVILRLAGEAGLRRAEIAQVHRDDVVEDLAGWSLRVHGKGGKLRTVPLSDEVAACVLDACRTGGGWALPGDDRGHLSPRYVGRLAADHLGPATLHQLRHRFATRAYATTRDLLAVQQLLGHTSPATTQCYVRPPDDAMRRAMLAAA